MADTGTLKDRRGFTLVEVIISIGFLCIACGVILQLFMASGRVREKTAEREMAALLAGNAVEACRISKLPENVGLGIFNPDFTDYSLSDGKVVVREYFGEGWSEPVKGVMPVYVVETVLEQTGKPIVTETAFGNGGSERMVSALYAIKVTVGFVDKGKNSGGDLAEYITSKHYVFIEGGK